MTPPRRSLPVRSRAPGSAGRQSGGGAGPRRRPTAGEDRGGRPAREGAPGQTPEEDRRRGMRRSSRDGGGGGEGAERGRPLALVALLANGRQVTVRVKWGKEESPPPPCPPVPQTQTAPPAQAEASEESSEPWTCHTCGKTNLPARKRCGGCQSWRGGTRKNISKKARAEESPPASPPEEAAASPAKNEEEEEEDEPPRRARRSEKEKEGEPRRARRGAKKEDEPKSARKGERGEGLPTRRSRNAEKEDEPPRRSRKRERADKKEDDRAEEREEAATSVGARTLPKRKRTNLYASLSPAAILATARARAEAFAAAPPSPQLASRARGDHNKPKARPQSPDAGGARDAGGADADAGADAGADTPSAHPVAIAVESATQESGAVPDEFIGQDGNLFYCRICLGLGEVVCCDGCPHVFHPKCLPAGPSKDSLENDDDPWYCHECVANGRAVPREPGDESPTPMSAASPAKSPAKKRRKAKSEKDGSRFEYDPRKLEEVQGAQSRLLSCGREERDRAGGRGSGGPGPRRTSSAEERMNRAKDSDEPATRTSDRRKRISSGFQSPYVEEDYDEVGPQSLAYVERPLSSTPAFFFFLLHNRAVIERSLYRKSPLFRGMARGPARNEKVAQEGAAIWISMTKKERDEWVEVSMKDFERRAVAWKEKEIIEAMVRSADEEDREAREGEGGESRKDEAPGASLEDELHVAGCRARATRFGRVKSHSVKVRAGGNSGNPILLELLNDSRFRPLPLVAVGRAEEDLSLTSGGSSVNEKTKVAVQQLAVQGPISTSLGDDCMGCTRGWSHWCSVMKRFVPGSLHRAKLQPPVGSLTATRIGLGLKVNLPMEPDGDQGGNAAPAEVAAMTGAKVTEACPNYQPRDSFFLETPSLRLDDTALFIENAMAMKGMKPEADAPYTASYGNLNQEGKDGCLSPTARSKKLSRGLLPLRGRKRKMSSDIPDGNGDSGGSSVGKGGKRQRFRCGGCGTIQPSPLGCMPCRKASLVAQIAKRGACSPDGVADEFLERSSAADCPNYGDGFVKPLCVMLGRTNLNEVSESSRKKNPEGGAERVGLSLTLPWWAPNAVMPPNPKRLPTPKPPGRISNKPKNDDGSSSDDCEESSTTSGSSSSGNGPTSTENGGGSMYETWDCTKCGNANDTSRSRCGSCQGWKGGKRENITNKSSRLRSCNVSKASAGGGGEGDEISKYSKDRNTLALKHKEGADELSRKCLSIACCGILLGMMRRDPMRLFAEPVPDDVGEYHKVIKDPIDFSTIRKKVLNSEYPSLGSFIGDAKRLCINACVFNAADSLYARTAKAIYDSLEVMHDRAKKWIAVLKNAHSSSFLANEDGKDDSDVDTFKDVRSMWPGAVELLEDSEWLEKQAVSDFVRTRENEIAYYGSLAIQRAAAAAEASLAPASDLGGADQPVARRSHVQDELLQKRVDEEASLHVGPIQLKDVPDAREILLLKLLKRVQKRRIEGRMSSESGCARCDGVKMGDSESNRAVSLLRSKFKRTIDATKTRVVPSRLSQSTGLASRNARELAAENNSVEQDGSDATNEEAPARSLENMRVATESMVSVGGSRIHGWGLFADHNFRKGEVVAEYIGEYVSDAVAELREKMYREQRIQDYQFRVDGSLVIDATLRGGYARYINHSCSPNCVAKVVNGKAPNEHLKRVLIVSQRDIQASEELSYDYQFPLEMNLDLRIPCNCGSKQCRGFMNWDTPEKSNRRTAKKIIISGGRRGVRRK